jgi:hypothetical protein
MVVRGWTVRARGAGDQRGVASCVQRSVLCAACAAGVGGVSGPVQRAGMQRCLVQCGGRDARGGESMFIANRKGT